MFIGYLLSAVATAGFFDQEIPISLFNLIFNTKCYSPDALINFRRDSPAAP
jgi:hypothetical protein